MPNNDAHAIAFDIGTTTLVASALNKDGDRIDALTARNPQYKWGQDVLSRVRAINDEPSLLDTLKDELLASMNELISNLTANPSVIQRFTATGNTVMEHILLGVSPASLSKVPYKPVFKDARTLNAKEVGLHANNSATLYTFPMIGGFVGGDAVAASLGCSLQKSDKKTLLVDIGTNSEILLSDGNTIFACAAAAGPAFEAGEIECGMYAAPGAIEGLSVSSDKVELKVVEEATPKGICGSGVVEAVHAFVEIGLIEPSGRIKDRAEVDTNISNIIKKNDDGNVIVLYRDQKIEVKLTQKDIRSFQVAKSAIRAAINILIDRSDIDTDGIDTVYIAGAFGSHLSIEGLLGIGLLPEELRDKVELIGDAALIGAELAISEEHQKEAERIAKDAKYVSLSGSAHFEKEFMRMMDFPLKK